MIPRDVSVSAAHETTKSDRASQLVEGDQLDLGVAGALDVRVVGDDRGPKPCSFWATWWPIRPSPMIPTVRDFSRWSWPRSGHS